MFAFLLMGILSIANYIVNLAYHSLGGDIFSVMALGYLCALGLPTVFLLVGTILFASALKNKGKWPHNIGAVLIMVGSVSLVLISLSTPPSPKQQEISETPETPPSSNTAEPSQPAPNLAPSNEPETGRPIPAIGTKNNPRTVPGLCEILLDEDEDTYSREAAAHALGQIGSHKQETLLRGL